MKKFKTIYILATAIILASCSSSAIDEISPVVEADSVPVLFGSQPQLEPLTRASDKFIDGSKVVNIPEGDNVGVFGFYQGTQDWDAWSEKTANFFYNQSMTVGPNVAITDSKGVVTGNRAPLDYSPKRYWPNTDGAMCSFFGYYPFVASGTDASTGVSSTNENGLQFTNKAGSGMGTFTYTVKPDEKDQADFLVSDMEANITKQKIDERVVLKFHHMLSQVVVNVRIGKDVTSYTINQLGFANLKSTGTLTPTCNKHEDNTYTTSFGWSGQSGSQDYKCPIGTKTENQKTTFILMPQKFDESSPATFSYNISYTSTQGTQDPKVETIQLKDSRFKEWLPGVVYTYTITLGADHIDLELSIDTWYQTGLGWEVTI